MNIRLACTLVTLGGVLGLQSTANATFHGMQIEQIIASVDGDNTAQAIQLRMRINGQSFVSRGRLIVHDAAGLNPITLIDVASNVPNGASGSRVLIASASFPAHTTPGAVPDFFMTDVIPPSYFAAGSLTWEDDLGTIYWRLSWGGGAYTGPNTGNTFNDVDGNFGPPFPTPLPSCGVYGVRFTKPANAKSMNNAADYKYDTAQTETYTNNAGAGFVVSTAALPTVKISTLDASASEVPATDTGRMRITRTTSCTQVALKVTYAVSGTATNGADYQTLTGSSNIPAGATTSMITVRPIDDTIAEPDETAIATLSPNAAYTIVAPSSGTVTIHSDE